MLTEEAKEAVLIQSTKKIQPAAWAAAPSKLNHMS